MKLLLFVCCGVGVDFCYCCFGWVFLFFVWFLFFIRKQKSEVPVN